MNYKIVNKTILAKDIKRLDLKAPLISQKAKAGQFVIVVIDEKAERIPLTLADWNKDVGTISIIFQEIGASTKRLGSLNPEDAVLHLLGPLGRPTEIVKGKKIICIGGGVGIAEVYPVARAFKEAGNKVSGIIGSRSKDLLILENELRQICDELFVATDDGSYGKKSFVTDILKGILSGLPDYRFTGSPDLVYAIGPVMMMSRVAELTRGYKIKTLVSLNPIMLDATGMCGTCRVTVDGKVKFGCVDGPEFDAHLVDFVELSRRLNLFKAQEQEVLRCVSDPPKNA